MNFLHEVIRKIGEAEARREAAIAKMEAAVQPAVDEHRTHLNAAEAAASAAAQAEVEAIDNELVQLRGRKAELEAVQAARDAANKTPTAKPITGLRTREANLDVLYRSAPESVRGFAMTALEQSRLSDDVRERASAAIDAAYRSGPAHGAHASMWTAVASDPAYARAFARIMTEGQHAYLDDEERLALHKAQLVWRGMSTTGSAGGFGVPTSIDPTIALSNAGTDDPMRRLARIERVTAGTWYGVQSAGVTSAFIAEGAVVSDGTPVLSQTSVGTYMNSAFVPASFEILQDYGASNGTLVDELARICADAMAVGAAAKYWDGTGSSQIQGSTFLLDSSTNLEVRVTTAGQLNVTDVRKLASELPSRFHKNASIVGHVGSLMQLRFSAASAGGTGAWQDFSGDTPPKLYGYSVYSNDSHDNFTTWSGSTGAANVLTIADFGQHYVVVDSYAGADLLPLYDITASSRPITQKGFLMWARQGGGVYLANAARLLNNP